MVKINSINSVNNVYFGKSEIAKDTSTQTNPQIDQLSNIRGDFAVKIPQAYSKTGEMDLPYGIKAHCYKLSNGQRVIIIPQEDNQTVVKTYVNTGSMNETDNIRGISHYIEHNLFNGPDGLEEGDFFKKVNEMGAYTNASTGTAETNYYISSNLLNKDDLETKIKLHASMLETPLFAVEKLEKEKGIVNSEINMITSNPQNIAMNRMLKNLYGIKTTSEDLIGGTCDNITNLKREDVVEYFNNNYYPSNMVTVITGDVIPDETIKLVSKYFTSKKQAPANRYFEKLTPVQKQVREDIISDKATASTIIVGFNGAKPSEIKDRVYLDALMLLLSNTSTSRINSQIKNYSSFSTASDEKISTNPQIGRAIVFAADCNDEYTEKILKEIFMQIGNVSNIPPTDEEMKIIKKTLARVFSSMLENSSETNDMVGTAFLDNSQDYINQYEVILNNMTSEDLVNTAKKYLDTNRVSVTVVHPNTATKEGIEKSYKSVSFTGNSKLQPINQEKVKEYSFDNNYRLITVNTGTNNSSLKLQLSTDIDFKPEPSCAMVLNELLNEGTNDKTQLEFNKELQQDGIFSQFKASSRKIACTIDCEAGDISKGFDAIKQVIYNPRFTQEDFEHAKTVVKDIILTSEKSASDKLNEELFKGMSKGYSKSDILSSLDKLTIDDVKSLYADILTHSKGYIAVAAPFESNLDLNKQIFNEISSLNKVKPFEPSKTEEKYKHVEQTKVLTDIDNKNQAEVLEAFKFKLSGNIKDTVSIDLLNIILGAGSSSRLFMDLREQQKLAYHVRSSFKQTNDIGLLTLKILTTTDNKDTGEQHFENIEKSINGFNQHIDKIKQEKVTEDELNNAKLTLKNILLNGHHASSDRAESLLNSINSQYGRDKINLMFDEIDKITVDDIYNAANYIFAGKPTYSILATQDTINANEEFFNKIA